MATIKAGKMALTWASKAFGPKVQARSYCSGASSNGTNPLIRKLDLVESNAKIEKDVLKLDYKLERTAAEIKDYVKNELSKSNLKEEVVKIENKLDKALAEMREDVKSRFDELALKQSKEYFDTRNEINVLSKSYDAFTHKIMDTVSHSHMVWLKNTVWVVFVGTALSSKLGKFIPTMDMGVTPEPTSTFFDA